MELDQLIVRIPDCITNFIDIVPLMSSRLSLGIMPSLISSELHSFMLLSEEATSGEEEIICPRDDYDTVIVGALEMIDQNPRPNSNLHGFSAGSPERPPHKNSLQNSPSRTQSQSRFGAFRF